MRIAELMRGALVLGVAGAVLLLERTRRARAYVEPRSTHTGRNLVVAGLAAATVHTLEAPAVMPPGEISASIPWRAAQILAIGVTPRALTLWQGLTIVSVLFHHSNTRLSDRSERFLSWIVATPKMHAIHHSIDPAQLQSNFSSGLAIWDRLHRTARFDADPRDVRVGVVGHLGPKDVTLSQILELPFSDRALPSSSHA